MTKKHLSKGLKVLPGMRITGDTRINVVRAKKGNSSMARKKKKKKNKNQHLPLTTWLQKLSEKPHCKRNHLLQGLHFRADSDFYLGYFPGLIFRKTALTAAQSHAVQAWPGVPLGFAMEKGTFCEE